MGAASSSPAPLRHWRIGAAGLLTVLGGGFWLILRRRRAALTAAMATAAQATAAQAEKRSEPVADVLPQSKGERLLKEARKPRVEAALPEWLRAPGRLHFDTCLYDLRLAATALLASLPDGEIGCFPSSPRELEMFRASDEVFRSFQPRQQLRSHLTNDKAFLDTYERLVAEIVCPHLKSVLLSNAVDSGLVRFVYQYPPTLRIQPGPSKQFKRPHRDAEYGHQVGEINFWMPLTNYSEMTKTALWVESQPNIGDYTPLDIDYGSLAMFHGTLCRHSVPANKSKFTRVSLDFRVGVGNYYDPEWTLEGVKASHGRRELLL